MSIQNNSGIEWRHSQRPFIELVQGKDSREIIKNARRFLPQFVIENSDIFFGVATNDILSEERERRVSHPRGEIAYLLVENLGLSLPMIAKKLGDRDHTTILNYIKGVRAENNGYRTVSELEKLWVEIEKAYKYHVYATNRLLLKGFKDEDSPEKSDSENI